MQACPIPRAELALLDTPTSTRHTQMHEPYLLSTLVVPAHTSCAGYIGEFEIVDDHRSGKIVVNLVGRINKVGVISPRFDVKMAEVEKWVNNLLPSRQFGHIVLTTSAGIFDHEEARRKRTGGKVLGVSAAGVELVAVQ